VRTPGDTPRQPVPAPRQSVNRFPRRSASIGRGRGGARDVTQEQVVERLRRAAEGHAEPPVRLVREVAVAVGFGVSRPGHVRVLRRAGADGVIVAPGLVDAFGADGRDVAALGGLLAELRGATAG
jgi:tryptophan synthase alpha chain